MIKRIIATLLMAVCAPALAYGPYTAVVDHVHDGDSVIVHADIYPDLVERIDVRLAGINAAEMTASDPCEHRWAERATAFLKARVHPGDRVTLTDLHLGKFAHRAIAHLIDGGQDMSQALLVAGLVHRYDGKGKRKLFCK